MIGRLFLTGIAATALALAQGGGDMGGGMGGGSGRGGQDMGGGGMGGGGMRSPKPTKADQIVSKLKLNKDQKGEAETILQATAQEAAPLRDQLRQARAAFASALIDGKPDDAAKALKIYTDRETQMTGFEVKAFQKIYALLKPNQTARAGEAFDLMADIFDMPAPRDRGGMGRGGGGSDMGGGAGRGRGR